MPNYSLSLEAQKSLINIKNYSIKKFGHQRTIAYLQSIQQQMNNLAKNPNLGIIRTDLNIGYYSSFIETHTIYYTIKHSKINIIDVLHQSMDPTKHIS